jgi:hypothetical protein
MKKVPKKIETTNSSNGTATPENSLSKITLGNVRQVVEEYFVQHPEGSRRGRTSETAEKVRILAAAGVPTKEIVKTLKEGGEEKSYQYVYNVLKGSGQVTSSGRSKEGNKSEMIRELAHTGMAVNAIVAEMKSRGYDTVNYQYVYNVCNGAHLLTTLPKAEKKEKVNKNIVNGAHPKAKTLTQQIQSIADADVESALGMTALFPGEDEDEESEGATEAFLGVTNS